MINNTPLAMLKSDTAMAVKAQKAMNLAMVGETDWDRYRRASAMQSAAMDAPGFCFDEFKRICRAYGIDY